jgi:TMEM175 potassium channel family protein
VTKGRLEAFSDGVIAILITIMVLELKVPHGTDVRALAAAWPTLVTYILSFLFLGIYWNNHHHLLHAATRIDGKVLWANLHLLFWLSLVPFFTGWMGENWSAPVPTAVYGVVLLLAAVGFLVLSYTLVRAQGEESRLAAALGSDIKGKMSLALYASAVPLAFVETWISIGIYFAVALIWLVPDPRIERKLTE